MSLNKISINDTTTVNTGVVYDITKATSQSYDSLSAALGTDGNNVPLEIREGGMSIRFVSNSYNKYVQYRLMSDEWSTTESKWQGVDEEIKAGSKNLAESGAVNYETQKIIAKQSSLVDIADTYNVDAAKIGIDKAGHLMYLIHPDGSKQYFTKVYFDKGLETNEYGDIDSAFRKAFSEIDTNGRKQFNIASIEKTYNTPFVKITIDKAGKRIKAYDVNGKEFFFAAVEFQGDFKSNNIDGKEFLEYDLMSLTYNESSAANNRCWLDGDIAVSYGDVVRLTSEHLDSFETSIVIYDSDNNVIAASSFSNSRSEVELTIPSDSTKLRLSIKKKDNTAISEFEGRTAIKSLLYSRNSFAIASTVSENYVRQITKSYIHRYNGETIDFNDAGSYEFIPYLTIPNWLNSQGGAIYKDYLITTIASDVDGYDGTTPNAFIFDLKNGNKINDLYLGRTLGDVEYSWPHCNQVCFGNEYYNDNSDFPLLYVSMVNGGSGEASIFGRRGVFVYDIHLDGSSTLVQVIYPNLTDTALMDKIGAYTPNYIVDTDNNKIVILGYHNASWYDWSGGTPVCIIGLPTLSDGEVIVFTNNDVIESYILEKGFGIQQSFYHKGKVYIQGGLGGAGAAKAIRVLDLNKKRIVTYIDLSYRELEPQFIGLWKTKLLWYDAGTSGVISEIKLGK